MKPRVKRPESRRQELLDAALEVFREQGIEKPTVSDITTAAGAAKGTFYRYFATKEDLVRALQHEFEADLAAAMEKALAAVDLDDPYAPIEATIRAATNYYLANVWVHDALFREPMGSDVADPIEESKVLAVIANLIEDGIAQGRYECDRPDLTAFLIFSAIHGGLDHLVRSGGKGKKQLVTAMSQLLWRAVKPDGLPRQARSGRVRR